MNTITCPHCSGVVTINAPGRFQCPICSGIFEVPASFGQGSLQNVGDSRSPTTQTRQWQSNAEKTRPKRNTQNAAIVTLLAIAAILLLAGLSSLLIFLPRSKPAANADSISDSSPSATIGPELVQESRIDDGNLQRLNKDLPTGEMAVLHEAWIEEDRRNQEGLFLKTPSALRKQKIYLDKIKRRRELQTEAVIAGRNAQDVLDEEDKFFEIVEAELASSNEKRRAAANAVAAQNAASTGVTIETEKAIYVECFEMRKQASVGWVGNPNKTTAMQSQRRKLTREFYKKLLGIQVSYGVSQKTIFKILEKGDKAGWGKTLLDGNDL